VWKECQKRTDFNSISSISTVFQFYNGRLFVGKTSELRFKVTEQVNSKIKSLAICKSFKSSNWSRNVNKIFKWFKLNGFKWCTKKNYEPDFHLEASIKNKTQHNQSQTLSIKND
jgi:hypothetical protein